MFGIFSKKRKGKGDISEFDPDEIEDSFDFLKQRHKKLAKALASPIDQKKILDEEKLNKLPGKRKEASTDLNNFEKNESLLKDNLYMLSENTQSDWKSRLLFWKKPVANVVKKVEEDTQLFKDYVMDTAEQAGFIHYITGMFKDIMKSRATEYLEEHAEENNSSPLGELGSKLSGATSLRDFAVLASQDYGDLTESAFAYLAFKGAMWLADKNIPDINEVSESVKNNLASTMGTMATVKAEDYAGGYADKAKKNFYDKVKADTNMASFILYDIQEVKVSKKAETFFKINENDLMLFYKKLNPANTDPNINKALEELRR